MGPIEVEELARRVRAGSARALARGLTWIEEADKRAETLLEQLYGDTGHAHVVGITGAPGSGKSTLVRAMTRVARARGMTVGVLAVDPSSPFTGGSILGDRIRMNDLVADSGLFVRSMATRGALGGLCHAAAGAVDLLSAAGKGLVLVETVGVGQDEVDVMRLAQTTIVVSVPGLGDDIQALKAGIIEIADIHAVNKADREGARRTLAEIRATLAMAPLQPGRWQPPLVACVATTEQGADALVDEVSSHLAYLKSSGELLARERRIAEARVQTLAESFIVRTLKRPGVLASDIDLVVKRKLSPYRCARALLVRASDAERTSHV